MAQTKPVSLQHNRNDVPLKEGASYDGLTILKVLRVVISDEEVSYMCLMDDGSKALVPSDVIEEARA